MNKKDRIAVVVSIVYFFILIPAFLKHPDEGVLFAIPVFVYWGYRFIQNDISFLKVKDD